MIAQDIEKILLSEEEIENRCVELAHQIEEDYKESGETPIVVGLLKGSVPFMAELIKRFEFPCEIDFMSVSSYDGTESIGDVRCVTLLDKPSRRVCEIEADYVGFEVPNEFVVGYGLDYNQKYRNLPFVGVLKPEIYQ